MYYLESVDGLAKPAIISTSAARCMISLVATLLGLNEYFA